MLRKPKFGKIMFVFFISCCMFTYTSYAQKTDFPSSTSPYKKIELKDIIKGKQLLNEIIESNLTNEFRVFIKTYERDSYNILKQIGKNFDTFLSYSGVAVTLSKSKLLELIFDGKIASVWENAKLYKTADDYSLTLLNYTQEIANFTQMVSADTLWNAGFYGSGINVAILDSGIMTDHPALNETMSNKSRIIGSWNFVSNNADVEDDNGHGTSVAGLIGANGLHGYSRGVAPDCSFLIGKILDYNGEGTIELLIQGIDWAIENNADIINLSLGTFVTDKESPEIEAVNNAVGNNTLVCVAAGNTRGKEEFGYNDMFTILTPGIAKKAITVGAIDNNFILYKYSSAGPVAINYDTLTDNFVFNDINLQNTWMKPDVVAPGVKLNTTAYNHQNTTIVSGTSYSTAVVSGVCALLKSYLPDKQSSTIKASFLDTSNDISPQILTPLGEKKELTIPPIYQGAGLINATEAAIYLIDPPPLTIWPKQLPYTREVFHLNEYDSSYVSVYVNNPLSSFSLQYYDSMKPSLRFTYVPRFPHIAQYDILVELATTQGILGYNNFPVNFYDGLTGYKLDISYFAVKGKGRILYDCNEIGENVRYSMYGNLNKLLTISKYFGLIPTILSKDGEPLGIAEIDLNHYEALSIINYNSSILHTYSNYDVESIVNYIKTGGMYTGKTLILFPTRISDLGGLNSVLDPFNITYNSLLIENESLDVSSIINPLTRSYNVLDILSLCSPLEVLKMNDTLSTIANRFVYSDLRSNGGNLIIAANNVDMFMNSPYLFNDFTLDYEPKFSSLYFGDNYKLYENIMYSSTISDLSTQYSISTTEIKKTDSVEISLSANNSFGPLIGWDFFLTLESVPEQSYEIRIIYRDIIDYNNGNYSFIFSPQNYPIPGGIYLLSIRSPSETKTWTVYILEDYSWGPTLVFISIAVCIIFFVLIRIKKPKK